MVSRQIDEVKRQMVNNLDTVLARGERIEALVESTSTLNTRHVSLLSVGHTEKKCLSANSSF
jgi:hypothetical protein